MVSITEVTSEQFSAVFDTHVRGVMFGIKHAAGIHARQGSGSIITIASVRRSIAGGISGPRLQRLEGRDHSPVA
jgi:NAD(P)-dependent dehydrogenase (short-subunit alcohol dehydrogenase family)